MESQDQPLSPLDQQAIDALIDAGFEAHRVPFELRDRCTKLAALLGVLETPAQAADSPGSLAARTMGRVKAVRELSEDTLSADDAAALDALVAAEYDVSLVGEPLRERAARLGAIGDAITASAPGARPADLAARTFGLVMLAADRPLARVEPSVAPARVRWRDFAGIAAVLMVGASVVVPVLSASRQQQLRGGCTANLRSIASAFSTYASDNRDSLPLASASMGGVWWDVGKGAERSNSANLFTLARKGYASVRDMACPGNTHAAREDATPETTDWRSVESVSYSYQIMFGNRRLGWRDPRGTAILADRSPVVLRALAHEPAIPMENSPNHDRRGQSVLFCDGSVRWQGTPELARGERVDNIWLPWAIEEVLRQIGAGEPVTLQGKEMPGSDEDAFLAP